MTRIRCVVERITLQNPENGYSVLKVNVKGYDDLVTLVGNLLDVRLGRMLQTMRDTCLFDTPAWSRIRQRIEKGNQNL